MRMAVAHFLALVTVYAAQTFASDTAPNTATNSETATYIQRTDSMEPPDGICPGTGKASLPRRINSAYFNSRGCGSKSCRRYYWVHYPFPHIDLHRIFKLNVYGSQVSYLFSRWDVAHSPSYIFTFSNTIFLTNIASAVERSLIFVVMKSKRVSSACTE